jgi:hypothetical protein
MDSLKFVTFLYNITPDLCVRQTHLTNLILNLLAPQISEHHEVDVQLAISLNAIADFGEDISIQNDFAKFVMKTDALCEKFNESGQHDHWILYLKSQLDQHSAEAKLVDGARRLSKAIIQAQKEHKADSKDVKGVLLRLHRYCQDNDILKAIFTH